MSIYIMIIIVKAVKIKRAHLRRQTMKVRLSQSCNAPTCIIMYGRMEHPQYDTYNEASHRLIKLGFNLTKYIRVENTFRRVVENDINTL